jgi:hypothetical protein
MILVWLSPRFILAQEETTEWTIEKASGGGIAKWRIEQASVADVWTAMMRIAFIEGQSEGEKELGTINIAVKGARIKILLTQVDTSIDVVAGWHWQKGEKMQTSTPFSQAKKYFNGFFGKVKLELKSKKQKCVCSLRGSVEL